MAENKENKPGGKGKKKNKKMLMWAGLAGGGLALLYLVFKGRGGATSSAPASSVPLSYSNPSTSFQGSGGPMDTGNTGNTGTDTSLTAIEAYLQGLQAGQAGGQNTNPVPSTGGATGGTTTPTPAPRPTTTPAPRVVSTGGGGPLLQVGSSGVSVTNLQRSLGISQDGIFGPQTQAAVKQYQQSHGLSVDGVVGNQTWGSINSGGASGFKPAANVVNFYGAKTPAKAPTKAAPGHPAIAPPHNRVAPI